MAGAQKQTNHKAILIEISDVFILLLLRARVELGWVSNGPVIWNVRSWRLGFWSVTMPCCYYALFFYNNHYEILGRSVLMREAFAKKNSYLLAILGGREVSKLSQVTSHTQLARRITLGHYIS